MNAEVGVGLHFSSRNAVISFGSTAQDVLSLLGAAPSVDMTFVHVLPPTGGHSCLTAPCHWHGAVRPQGSALHSRSCGWCGRWCNGAADGAESCAHLQQRYLRYFVRCCN